MTFFTDSPFERMMVQTPKEGREDNEPPALPDGHHCIGCNYKHAACYSGTCHRDIIMLKKKKSEKDL